MSVQAPRDDLTTLLRRWRTGTPEDRDRLLAAVRGELHRVSLDANQTGIIPQIDFLALHEALERLATFDLQKSQVVELRFFGGLSIEQTAEVLKIGHATVA